MKGKDEAQKLYYIEPHSSMIGEEIKLYTWEDVCDLVRQYQHHYLEEKYVIREFGAV